MYLMLVLRSEAMAERTVTLTCITIDKSLRSITMVINIQEEKWLAIKVFIFLSIF